MSGYQIGVLFHLIGVILFFAGVAIATVVVSAAKSREKPSEVALILSIARYGAIFLGAGGVILLLAGFYLSGKIEGFGQRWLEISILLFIVSLVLGYLGGRRARSTREYAVGLADRGEGDAQTLRTMLENRATAWLYWLSALLAVVVLVLMIWQPGA